MVLFNQAVTQVILYNKRLTKNKESGLVRPLCWFAVVIRYAVMGSRYGAGNASYTLRGMSRTVALDGGLLPFADTRT